MTPHELMGHFLRCKLREKQQELANNTADCLGARDLREQRAAQAAVRRNEKSLALLTSKLLCTHEALGTSIHTAVNVQITFYRCSRCLTTVSFSNAPARVRPEKKP